MAKMSDSEAMGRAIAVVRTGRGLAQKELATKLGISFSYVSLLEHGKRDASLRMIEAIGKVLDILPSRLFQLKEAMKQGEWERAA